MIIALKRESMKIGIFYKKENPQIVNKIKEEIDKYSYALDNDNPDVVFSIGGDGTFLRAVHYYLDKLDSILFIGINSGSLGFLYDFNEEEIPLLFKNLFEGKFETKNYRLLEGKIKFSSKKETIYALNEIRLENPFHTLTSDVFINHEKLENYRGNGLIVSSPLGSSAYNKSLGGALIDPELEVLELTEIAGISNNIYRSLGSSLVINGDKIISFKGELNNSVVGYDYLNIHNEDKLEQVDVSYSNKKIKIICKNNRSYVEKIRKSFVL